MKKYISNIKVDEDAILYGCLEKAYLDVEKFHRTFNHPSPDSLIKLDDDRKKLRAAWIKEELEEFLNSNTIEDDADALIDMLYFILGTFVEMGLEPSPIFDIVQNCNMKKLFPDGKPHYNENNKVIKPEGWVPPEDEIRKYIQGLKDNGRINR